MFTDISTTCDFPKTLIIRNSKGGMIWQVYHVQKESEASKLSFNATRNGFESINLEDYQPHYEETFPNWREECSPDILS
jgi:hypothetical protein